MTQHLDEIHGQAGPITPERMAQIRAAMEQREQRAPQVGDEAPDFELPLLHGDGRAVRLSGLRGRPVALIFGSYT